MNEEDKKYLRSVSLRRPSSEIFERMVQILTQAQTRIDQLLQTSLIQKLGKN